MASKILRRVLRVAGMSCAAVLLLSSCRGSGDHSGHPPADPSDPDLVLARMDRSPLAFTMKTRPGERLDSATAWQDGNCALVGSGLRTAANEFLLGFQAVPDDCEPAGKPGNGRHGHYRSLDDAAAVFGTDAIHVDRTNTALGPADLFTQSYYECTNSCHTYREPVAIIGLTTPADARYHALMVYSPHGIVTTEQLMGYLKLLGTLR